MVFISLDVLTIVEELKSYSKIMTIYTLFNILYTHNRTNVQAKRDMNAIQNEYKAIPGYSHYKINRKGEVISTKGKAPRVLKPQLLNQTGHYYSVSLYDDDKVMKIWTIHKLVWTVFNGEVPDGFVINHIDNSKTLEARCSLDNLELLTQSKNSQTGPGTKQRRAVILVNIKDLSTGVYSSSAAAARSIVDNISGNHIATIADRIRVCIDAPKRVYDTYKVFDADNSYAKAYMLLNDLIDKRSKSTFGEK